MGVEYARRGLVGVLTPQANTTVEPEFGILLPPGIGMVAARLTSDGPTIVARLLDYLRDLPAAARQFANAPVGALAFACTGASYFAGVAEEDALVAGMEDRLGIPVVTAATAVRDAFHALGATRIGLVSPYPDDLTEAALRYWRERGFEVAALSRGAMADGSFHPIYAMSAAAAAAALAALPEGRCEAVAMLGTGMPTLGPILGQPFVGQAPVTSCMHALAWRVIRAVTRQPADRDSLLAFVRGEGWRGRHAERMGG
ncbi:maleate cis-trans isomerase family protein [Falsiroseomonas sp. CW058]|uniref:maleate cis-trans isomerase family protein n=1 Tax=Falsiroseomonas sp. CW058 TaxID=3388664 RepID=UPI003D319B5E